MLIEQIFFQVTTPLGFTVRVSLDYWELITTVKHPVMAGLERMVMATLEQPEEIRVSKSDSKVFLFYRTQKPGRWICAVVKKLDGEGFLITTYPTETIKEGKHIWPK